MRITCAMARAGVMLGLVSLACAAQAAVPVGILKSDETPSWADGLCQALRWEKDFEPELITDASPATLARFRVVVAPQLQDPSKWNEWIGPLRDWVAHGGGLLTTHDAVGYRRHAAIFPEVAKGHFHYYGKKEPYVAELCIARAKPFTPGFRQGDRIALAYFDYITIEPGPAGRVLARGVETSETPFRSGGPAVVYGEVGRGRYVACGSLPGMLPDEQTIEPPSGPERRLLTDCLRYLAGLLEDPDPTGAEFGARIELGAARANLLYNGGAELLDTAGRPEEIIPYNSDYLVPEWGVTSAPVHTGARALRLRGAGFQPKTKTDARWGRVGLWFGGEGAQATVVPAGKGRYEFSFWLKGDPAGGPASTVYVIAFGFRLKDGAWQRENIPLQNNEFQPGSDWQRCAVTFFSEGHTRLAPMVSLWQTEAQARAGQASALEASGPVPPGPEIFLDDAALARLETPSTAGLTVEGVRAQAERQIAARWADTRAGPVPPLAHVPLGANVEAPPEVLDRPNYDPWPAAWETRDLSGAWKIRKLDGPVTHVDIQRRQTPNPSNDEGTVQGYWKPDYDDSAWPERSVPGFWGTADKPLDPFAPDYVLSKYNKTEFLGIGWHRTRFSLPDKPAHKRLVLHFDRVHYEATVYLNGSFIGIHRGGNRPFEFDVTDAARAGDNVLAVRVFCDDMKYAYLLSYYGFGGIMGRVLLQARPEVYAATLLIDPRPATSEAVVRAELRNASDSPRRCALALEIEPDAANRRLAGPQGVKQTIGLGDIALQPGLNGLTFTARVEKAVAWSPEYPHLYRLTLSADGAPAARDRFGMRSFAAEGPRLLLNGRPFIPMGIVLSYFPFYNLPGVWENQQNIMRRILAGYRALGVTMIFPQGAQLFYPRLFYDICDETGIMIQEWQATASGSWFVDVDGMYDDANTAGRVHYLYNHPSFAMYTIGNECRDKRLVDPINHVYDLFRRLDGQGRPVCAVSGGVPDQLRFREDVVDVHGYFGVISGHPLDTRRFFEQVNRTVWDSHGRALPVGNWEMGGNKNPYPVDLYRAGRALFTDYTPRKTQIPAELFVTLVQYGLRRYFISDYEKAMRDPDFAELQDRLRDPNRQSFLVDKYRYHWVNKQVIEECRRLGALMGAGFGVNMTSAHTVYYTRSAEGKLNLDYFAPSRLRTSTLAASDLYGTFQRALNPRFICASVFDKNLFAGRPLELQVYAINNTLAESKPWRARVAVLDRQGAVLCDRVADVGAVPAGERRVLDFAWPIPAELPTGFYEVRLYLLENDAIVSDNQYEFFVTHGSDLAGRIEAGPRRVAVYDASRREPTTTSILKGLGVAFEPLTDFTRLNDYDVLIVGAESVDRPLLDGGASVRAWLEGGGRLLQFEQYLPGALPWLPGLSVIKRSGGNVGNLLVADHPVFAGIKADENWDTWNGPLEQAHQYGKQGGVFAALVGPMNGSELALGCCGVPREQANSIQMLVAEMQVGQGVALVSQPAATFRYDRDSVATRYVQNCIRHILSDDTRYAAVLGGPKLDPVNPRRCGVLELGRHAAQAVRAEPGWFENLARGLKDCGDVRFVMPGGKAALLTGPAEFALPGAVRYLDPEGEARQQQKDTDQGPLLKNQPDRLYLLAALPAGAAKPGAPAARITLHYADGKTERWELVAGRDLAPAPDAGDLENAWRAGAGFHVTAWQTPYPDVPVTKMVIEPLAPGGLVVGGVTMTLVRGKIHT